MTRRRRAAALLGLALLLGVLAASDVAGREAALRRQLGPDGAGRRRARAAAGGRAHRARARWPCARCPSATRPPGALRDPAGRRRPARRGGDRAAHRSRRRRCWRSPGADAEPRGPVLRRGERALDLVAVGRRGRRGRRARASTSLVTYDGRAGAPGATRLALADVEVLAARAPPHAPTRADAAAGLPRLLATLRVTVRQAVALTAAAAAARQVRLLPSSAGR